MQSRVQWYYCLWVIKILVASCLLQCHSLLVLSLTELFTQSLTATQNSHHELSARSLFLPLHTMSKYRTCTVLKWPTFIIGLQHVKIQCQPASYPPETTKCWGSNLQYCSAGLQIRFVVSVMVLLKSHSKAVPWLESACQAFLAQQFSMFISDLGVLRFVG